MIELKDVQVTAETSLQMAYAAALEGFFFDPCESTLRGGYEIGRKAIAEGVGVLEIASMHHAAVGQGFGDVRAAHGHAAVKIGDGARHAQDAVVRPG